MMTIQPLGDRIVVQRKQEKQQTQGGLHIPDSAQEKPQEAQVTAVGKGRRLDDGKIVPLEVKVGDRVLIGKYSGNEIKLDNQDYLIIREDDVLGILEGPAKLAKAS
jgi:chaperonin GroES